MMKPLLPLVFVFILFGGAGEAKEAEPMAADPAIEAKMIEIASELRCLVCQNESLAASHADFAVDLRREIREMLKKGMTEKQIVDFMVQRYGDFIRFRPPMKSTTVFLWFGPLILLLLGASVLLVSLTRRRRHLANMQLSEQDIQRAEQLLATSDRNSGHEDNKA